MRSVIELTITCKSQAIAQLLKSSTDPDNIELPTELTIDSMVNGKIYKVILTHNGSILTLRSTIDDLLQQMDVSLSVIKT